MVQRFGQTLLLVVKKPSEQAGRIPPRLHTCPLPVLGTPSGGPEFECVSYAFIYQLPPLLPLPEPPLPLAVLSGGGIGMGL